jgi:hypothetical protein
MVTVIVDDFESGLPSGDRRLRQRHRLCHLGRHLEWHNRRHHHHLVGDGDPLARARPIRATTICSIEAMVNGWGGLTHAFENEDVDTWVRKIGRGYEGIASGSTAKTRATTCSLRFRQPQPRLHQRRHRNLEPRLCG